MCSRTWPLVGSGEQYRWVQKRLELASVAMNAAKTHGGYLKV